MMSRLKDRFDDEEDKEEEERLLKGLLDDVEDGFCDGHRVRN